MVRPTGITESSPVVSSLSSAHIAKCSKEMTVACDDNIMEPDNRSLAEIALSFSHFSVAVELNVQCGSEAIRR